MKNTRVAAAALGAVVMLLGLLGTGPARAQDAAFPNGQDPVVLVHGLTGAGWNWDSFRGRLLDAGYTEDQILVFTYDSLGESNRVTARRLGVAVEDLLERTGAERVDLVGHSMGSLNTRWCIKYAGCEGNVDDWVSWAGPNNGSEQARLCWFGVMVSCEEMIPGSPFLTELNDGPSLPAGVSGTVVWSPYDGVVTPPRSSILPGLDVYEAPWVNHFSMLRDQRVADRTIAALAD